KETATSCHLIAFVGAYLVLASPAIAILSLWGLWLTFRAAIVERSQSSTILACLITPLLFYLLLHAVHQRAPLNWAAPIYPAFAVCAAIALLPVAGADRLRLFGVTSLIIGFLLCGFLYLHAINPIVGPNLENSTLQMRGWPQFAAEVE